MCPPSWVGAAIDGTAGEALSEEVTPTGMTKMYLKVQPGLENILLWNSVSWGTLSLHKETTMKRDAGVHQEGCGK